MVRHHGASSQVPEAAGSFKEARGTHRRCRDPSYLSVFMPRISNAGRKASNMFHPFSSTPTPQSGAVKFRSTLPGGRFISNIFSVVTSK